MRNLLEEFHEPHGVRPPTILGVREHIFTGRYVKFPIHSSLVCQGLALVPPKGNSRFENFEL